MHFRRTDYYITLMELYKQSNNVSAKLFSRMRLNDNVLGQ